MATWIASALSALAAAAAARRGTAPLPAILCAALAFAAVPAATAWLEISAGSGVDASRAAGAAAVAYLVAVVPIGIAAGIGETLAAATLEDDGITAWGPERARRGP